MTMMNNNTDYQRNNNGQRTTSRRSALDTSKLRTESEPVPQTTVFTLSRNPNRAMQEMMDTINDLRSVYEAENEALMAADTKAFAALLPQKAEIAHRYQEGAKQMIERREEFKSVDPDLKKKLQAMQESFSAVTSTNLSALDRVKRGVERLNDRIMKAARDTAQKENVSYSAGGSLNRNDRAVSVGLNESA